MLSLKSKHFNCSMPVLECFHVAQCFLLVQVQRPLIGTQVQTFQKCKTMSTGKMALVNCLSLVLPHFPSYVRLALDQSLPGPTCGAGSVDLITDRNGEVYKVRFMTHTYIFFTLTIICALVLKRSDNNCCCISLFLSLSLHLSCLLSLSCVYRPRIYV